MTNKPSVFSLSCKDALKWLKKLEDESVDLIITDPPYESLEKHRSVGTTTRLKNSKSSSNEWFDVIKNEEFEPLLYEIYRVLKKNRHFYLFCDVETMFVIKPIAENIGFRFWKPIIWDKVSIGMGYHYRCRYENILFFEKGKRKLNDLSIPDVLAYKRVYRGYPTEKPVDLLRVLVSQSSVAKEIIIDPFMGSGSTGVASLLENRNFLGCDIESKAVSLSRKRMKEVLKKEKA